jgi:hypothetical protein
VAVLALIVLPSAIWCVYTYTQIPVHQDTWRHDPEDHNLFTPVFQISNLSNFITDPAIKNIF